jgi:trehalose-phosphatase
MKYLLFLDYDGTLTPIVSKPSLAKLTKSQKTFLKKLSKARHLMVAIVSGRKLSELRKLVGVSGFYYAGNHGFEISGPKTKLTHPKALAAKPILNKIKKELKAKTRGIKGVLVEDKTLTLSLHYRLVKNRDLGKLKRIFQATIKPYLKKKKIRVTHGKKVFEVRPNVDWHKGKAVLWFMQKLAKGKKITPIYIGDDTTDEDAFKALRKQGETIRVGKTKKTHAQHVINNVNEVYRFLSIMALEF